MHLIDIYDRFIYKCCPFLAAGIAVGGTYWCLVTYGAITVMQVMYSQVIKIEWKGTQGLSTLVYTEITLVTYGAISVINAGYIIVFVACLQKWDVLREHLRRSSKWRPPKLSALYLLITKLGHNAYGNNISTKFDNQPSRPRHFGVIAP